MTRNIDFIDGVPNGRYTITDTGIVYDKTLQKVMTISETSHVYLKYTKGPSRLKALHVAKLVLIAFTGYPEFDFESKLIWVYHRNGDSTDFNVNNLEWALYKSDITISEAKIIYAMLRKGIDDNIEISRVLSRFIPSNIIHRLTRGTRACEIAKIIDEDYRDLPENILPKIINKTDTLSDDKVHEVCALLTKYGSTRKVCDILSPGISKSQIQGIAYGVSYRHISKLYFDDFKKIKNHFNDLINKPADTDDEKWSRIPVHLLSDPSIIAFVSSRGRFAKHNGEYIDPITHVNDNGVMAALRVRICGHNYLCSRIILATFGIDLPKMISYPYEAFSVRYKNGNKKDLSSDNLYWAPRYCGEIGNDEKCLMSLNDLCNELRFATNLSSSIEIRERCRVAIASFAKSYNQQIKISSGVTFAYYTRAFETLEWRKCSNVKGDYYVSDNGIVRVKNTMLQTHSSKEDPRNYVNINGLEYLVCKLVLKAFKPMKSYKNYYPKHVDGDFKNDTVENLEWVYLDREVDISKQKWKYHIKDEVIIPIDWIDDVDPSRYQISNLGRVYDSIRNRWMPSHMVNRGRTKRVTLRTISGKSRAFHIALGVIKCFRLDLQEKIDSYPKGGVIVNYADGDPANCVFMNLSITPRTLNDETVHQICSLIVELNENSEIVDQMLERHNTIIDIKNVQDIKAKRYYSNISDIYF